MDPIIKMKEKKNPLNSFLVQYFFGPPDEIKWKQQCCKRSQLSEIIKIVFLKFS